MKNIIWAIVALVLIIGCMLGSRYELKISSPIVAKMDRLTGDVWVANGGAWVKVGTK